MGWNSQKSRLDGCDEITNRKYLFSEMCFHWGYDYVIRPWGSWKICNVTQNDDHFAYISIKTRNTIQYNLTSIKRHSDKHQATFLSHKVITDPLHPNISMHILHTILFTFPTVLSRRICLTIKTHSWWL